jgi:hypothetical protein
MAVLTSGFYTVTDSATSRHSFTFDQSHGFYYAVQTSHELKGGRWEIVRSVKVFETRDFKEAVRRYEALIAREPNARHSSTLRSGSAL